jgi:hypothetical protein
MRFFIFLFFLFFHEKKEGCGENNERIKIYKKGKF